MGISAVVWVLHLRKFLPRSSMSTHPFLSIGALTIATLVGGPVMALQQPNGEPIPSEMGCDSGKPTGLASVFACICDAPGQCNIGAPCSDPSNCPLPSGTCETTLWHDFNDNTCIPSNLSGLDPWQDGSTSPETFTPTCPLTFTVVSRGTAIFGDVFGWYNVTGAKPTLEDLHPMLACDAAASTSVTLDVRSHPDYRGGDIGFFLATPEDHGKPNSCAGGDCCASLDRIASGQGHVFYSERHYNPDAAGASSYTHLIIYDSVITDRKFYFAWEDIFGGSNNDFTDIVTSVSGVECAGAGESCDTGEPGVCAHGITTCSADTIECVPLFAPTEEMCDRADNDCDGEIDEDTSCHDDIVAGCEGVTCPAGEVCISGLCADPCQDVECGDGEVCRGGLCFPGCNECNGVVCEADSMCLASGECSGDGTGAQPGDGPGGDGTEAGPGRAVGCSCNTSRPSTPGLALLALVATAFLPRRRRRRV